MHVSEVNLNSGPFAGTSAETAFETLKKLDFLSGYRVRGDLSCFSIRTFSGGSGLFLLFCYSFGAILLWKLYSHSLAVFVGILGLIVLIRYARRTKVMTVDTITRKVTLTCNDLIGKLFIRPVSIPFPAIQGFGNHTRIHDWFFLRSADTTHSMGIYIVAEGRAIFLLYLRFAPVLERTPIYEMDDVLGSVAPHDPGPLAEAGPYPPSDAKSLHFSQFINLLGAVIIGHAPI